MRNSCCILFLVFATGFLLSCQQKVQDKKFFDVPEYFNSQIDTIKSKYTTLKKYAVYNEDSSITRYNVKEVNWKKEFALFIECDINKPIYYANAKKSGEIDSVGTSYEEYNIESKSTVISKLLIRRYNGFPFIVTINLSKDNLISSTKIELSYNALHIPFFVDNPEAEIRYSIRGEQSIKGLNQKNSFEVVGIISNRD